MGQGDAHEVDTDSPHDGAHSDRLGWSTHWTRSRARSRRGSVRTVCFRRPARTTQLALRTHAVLIWRRRAIEHPSHQRPVLLRRTRRAAVLDRAAAGLAAVGSLSAAAALSVAAPAHAVVSVGAASTTTFAWQAGTGASYADASAADGQGRYLWADGSGTGTVWSSAATSAIMVRAAADLCDGSSGAHPARRRPLDRHGDRRHAGVAGVRLPRHLRRGTAPGPPDLRQRPHVAGLRPQPPTRHRQLPASRS
jgi:hypothetical protein